jgi:hypothetical protein
MKRKPKRGIALQETRVTGAWLCWLAGTESTGATTKELSSQNRRALQESMSRKKLTSGEIKV